MLEFLPEKLFNKISNLGIERISEIRLRLYKPMFICIDGIYKEIFIKDYVFDEKEIQSIITKLTKHSIYAYIDNIRAGYLYGNFGERIGLCGVGVYDESRLTTLKDFNSLCIRVPHAVVGCANKLFDLLVSENLPNLLIISPPGVGKTTLLREIARLISNNYLINVLVIDEKNELWANGYFDLGKTTDVMVSSKCFGFNSALLNMRPDLIITDELSSENDVLGAEKARLSGVKIIASAHGSSLDEVKKKESFKRVFSNLIFDYCVTLSLKCGYGTIEKIEKFC